MIAFIDDHRDIYGVEPVCRVLPIAPLTYHAHVAQRADPAKASPHARRDMTLMVQIRRAHKENFDVFGARKVWRQLGRECIVVARCTVERLMRGMGHRHRQGEGEDRPRQSRLQHQVPRLAQQPARPGLATTPICR